MCCHARLLSNNYSAPVANGHKVAAGGSVAGRTTAYSPEQIKKAESEAREWRHKYGSLWDKRNEEKPPLPKVSGPRHSKQPVRLSAYRTYCRP